MRGCSINPLGWSVVALLGFLAAQTGCLRQIAVNALADSLAGSGGVFASDDDPDLIRDAAPFSLKLMESVLAETPRHRELLLSTSSSFTQYAFAFVQQDADEIETHDVAAAQALRLRAKKLFLRARDYGLRGLEQAHPGVAAQIHQNARQALQAMTPRDVPLLYWTAAAWGSAISVAKSDPNMVADQAVFEAMIDRALELNESFDSGAIHALLIAYEPSRQGATTPADVRSRQHFERAVQLSDGLQAGPYVSYAEAIMIKKQDRTQFQLLLEKALAVNVDARPQWRLANLIMQRRARWLLSRVDELFLE